MRKLTALLAVFCLAFAASSATRTTIPPEWIDEAVEWFRDMIRIRTASLPVPAQELPLLEYVQDVLTSEGIDSEITALPFPPFEMHMLLARYDTAETMPVRGDKLLLSGHADTVAQNNMPDDEAYTAVIKNGLIYGRGAVDMKHKLAYDMSTLIWLKRLNIPLEHGVMLGIFPAEELGVLGHQLAAANPTIAAELMDAGLVIEEGGGLTVEVLGKTLMPVTVGEKGLCWIRVTATGDEGHCTSYIPEADSPVWRLARAATAILGESPAKQARPTEVTSIMLNEIEQGLTAPSLKRLINGLRDPMKYERTIAKIIAMDELGTKFLIPQLSYIYNSNGLSAYQALTIVPGTADMTIVAMVQPGDATNCDRAADEMLRIVNDPAVSIDTYCPTGFTQQLNDLLAGGTYVDPNEAHVLKMMDAIKATAAIEIPDIAVTHSLFQAISGCLAYTNMLDMPCIGFEPARMSDGVYPMDLLHAANENIPLAGFQEGIELYFHSVEKYVTEP